MSFEPFSFTCPYCDHAQAVTEPHFNEQTNYLYLKDNEFGYFGYQILAVSCANSRCQKVTLKLSLLPYTYTSGLHVDSEKPAILDQRILPESSAKALPDYIPTPLAQDYKEACRIRDLSPKASATLARRCLQGMIRDFCGISKGRLIDEIKELKKRVDEECAPKNVSDDSIEAIDAVRKIGNIGAHMEKDINTIIDVDSNEAQILIELIETLFDEWYVERDKRKNRFAKLNAIAEQKDSAKKIKNAD
jgi:hypothetical protein